VRILVAARADPLLARRYLRTRWATSLALVSRSPVPVRVGDVLVLPMGSLDARNTRFAKLLDWSVGRDFSPLSVDKDFVARARSRWALA
jgi:hypothetical protein